MHTVADSASVASVATPQPIGGLTSLAPSLFKVAVWTVVVLGGFLAGMAVVSLALPALTALAVMAGVGLAVSPLIGFRRVPLVGLIASIPLPFSKHLTYVPHIGAADGLVIELVDIWLAGLLALYVYLRETGQATRIRGLGAFCLPLAALLLADVLSFRYSADVSLSLYGLVNEVRTALVFLALAVALVQGPDAMEAGLTGVMWAVLGIGAVCLLEAALGFNIWVPPSPNADTEWAGEFRAAAFGSPTNTAAYLAMLIPLVVAELIRTTVPVRRHLAQAALVVGLLGIACTLTRAAMGFLALASIPLLVFLVRERVLRARHLMAAFVGIAALGLALSEKIASRAEQEPDNMTARIGLMDTAINMARDSPVTGQGLNTYMVRMDEFAPKRQIHHFEFVVHNKFLLTLAETGGLGLLAFAWFLIVALTKSISLARQRTPLGIALLSSMMVTLMEMNMEIFAGGFTLLTVMTVAAFIAALSSSSHGDAAAMRAR
jgi:O-Antigen ligase